MNTIEFVEMARRLGVGMDDYTVVIFHNGHWRCSFLGNFDRAQALYHRHIHTLQPELMVLLNPNGEVLLCQTKLSNKETSID